MNKVETEVIDYVIKDPMELNLSYMPFISGGGLFIPTELTFVLGDRVCVDLLLPTKKESIRIKGKVIWITPHNAFHHVLSGIGIQFIDENAKAVRAQIEANLDNSIDVGGYTYGIMGENK
jgi:type IV pilus assembly protein PilZ